MNNLMHYLKCCILMFKSIIEKLITSIFRIHRSNSVVNFNVLLSKRTSTDRCGQ